MVINLEGPFSAWEHMSRVPSHGDFSSLRYTYYNFAAEAKVKIFWEGHKNSLNLPLYFDLTKSFFKWEILFKFCVLLTISELYISVNTTIFVTWVFWCSKLLLKKCQKRFSWKTKARHKRLKIINLTFKWLINLSQFMLKNHMKKLTDKSIENKVRVL